MIKTAIETDKIKAYEAAKYWVHANGSSFALQVGNYSPQLIDLYRETGKVCGTFITAYNPLGELTDQLANQSAQKRLKEHLQALTTSLFNGEGKDPDEKWPGEPSFLALGLDEVAARWIGKQFRQNAIIWADRDAIPQLILLR